MSREVVGLIPVKGDSERVEKKNLRPFGNTNLFELKLQQLKLAKGFSEIIVSSEDQHILKIAEQHGYTIHNRDPYYSTCDVPMSEVYTYIASEITGEHIAWLNVTNPLAEGPIYSQAIEKYKSMTPDYDCLLSVYGVQDYFFFTGQPINFKPYPWPRSQDLEEVYAMSFLINILPRQDLINRGTCVGEAPYFFLVDKVSSWDIDFQYDFDFCESIYLKKPL